MESLVDVLLHNKERTVVHVAKKKKKLIPKIFQEFDLSIVFRNSDIRPAITVW